MTNLDLRAILDRSQHAYSKVVDQFIDGDVTPMGIRQHFNYDVPALIGAVKRLTAERDQALEAHGRTVDGVMAAGWERVADEMAAAAGSHGPAIVTICGSTRFRTEMTEANRRLTLAGYVVLAPGVFGHDGDEMTDEQKAQLDELHFRKIDLAGLVYIVNPGGYIGESTAREIAYARIKGKRVRMLVESPEPVAGQGDTVGSLRTTLAAAEADGWAGWMDAQTDPQDCSYRDEQCWSIPKVEHDEEALVGPHIHGNWIYRAAGESDAAHTRVYAAQLLAAADELDRRQADAEVSAR